MKTKEETFIELFKDYSIELELNCDIGFDDTNLLCFYDVDGLWLLTHNIGNGYNNISSYLNFLLKKEHKMHNKQIEELIVKFFNLKNIK